MNLDVLNKTFPVREKPGLDTLDPRWADLSALVQASEFAVAARASEELLQQEVYDVRLIGYLCLGAFLDGGPGALGPVLRALASVLEDNWQAIGPEEQRERVTQQSLAWLLKQISKQLQHGESTKGEAWQAWLRKTTAPQIDEALASSLALKEALALRLNGSAASVSEVLGKLQAWLRGFCDMLPRADVRPEAPSPAGDGVESGAPTAAAPPPAIAAANAVESSYHLALLLKKIDALAILIERRNLTAARIVADDLDAAVARFDPLLYFPRLFCRYAELMARHAGELSELKLDADSPPIKALRAFYRVDLDEFVKLG